MFTLILYFSCVYYWRYTCSLMADELDTGIKGPGLRPNQISVLCSCAKHLTPTVPLFTQEYEWVPANFQENLIKCRGVTLQWTGIPFRQGVVILVTSYWGNQDNLQLNGLLGLNRDLTFNEVKFMVLSDFKHSIIIEISHFISRWSWTQDRLGIWYWTWAFGHEAF